jgi:hypothetical protein
MARIDRRVSPNQSVLWTVAELRGYARRRAINGPLAPVNHGQQRIISTPGRPRSGVVSSKIRRSSKLVMRVRFPSPAPPRTARSQYVHCGPGRSRKPLKSPDVPSACPMPLGSGSQRRPIGTLARPPDSVTHDSVARSLRGVDTE